MAMKIVDNFFKGLLFNAMQLKNYSLVAIKQ